MLFAKERFTERERVGAERQGGDPSPALARSVPFRELEGQGLRRGGGSLREGRS